MGINWSTMVNWKGAQIVLKTFLKIIYVTAIIGIVFAFLSAVLFALNNGCYDTIGVVSTLVSIVLGLVSITYTYQSSQEQTETLAEMRQQYKSLVNKINDELCKSNYDENNIDSLYRK